MTGNPAENEVCPQCGAPAVDMTTSEEPCKRWLCIGAGSHEWTENDIIDEFEVPEQGLSFLGKLFNKFSR